jgi:hypothetical protein
MLMGAIPLAPGLCALAVQRLLLFLAYRITIIGHTAHSGPLLAMGPPAAKGTAQVFATAITWMSQEKDPAMPAADQASAQQGPDSEHRSQKHVILPNQSGRPLPSIPLRTKLEILPDLNCKKPMLSLKLLMY